VAFYQVLPKSQTQGKKESSLFVAIDKLDKIGEEKVKEETACKRI